MDNNNQNMTEMFEDVLTFDAACAFLGITSKQLYNYTYQKRIPYYKPTGRRIFFRKSELAEFALSNRVAPQSEIEEQARQITRRPAAV